MKLITGFYFIMEGEYMNSSVYDELHSVLNDLLDQRDKIQKEIEENNLQIHEAQCFADEILSKDEEDFNMFSPRKFEDIYRSELDESYGKKSAYENANSGLISKKEELDKLIDVLQNVSSDWKRESENVLEKEKYDQQKETYILNNKKNALDVLEVQYKYLADRLNDHILQKLFHATHKLETGSKFVGQDPARAKQELNLASIDIQDSIAEIRNMIYRLCPLNVEHMELKQALQKMISAFNKSDRYRMDSKIEDVDFQDTNLQDPFLQLSIYRVVQECLLNIQKHANAKNVVFYFGVPEESNDTLVIRIEDDGIGFHVKKYSDYVKDSGTGIYLMKARAFLLNGSLDITSDPENKGTKVKVEIPVIKMQNNLDE